MEALSSEILKAFEFYNNNDSYRARKKLSKAIEEAQNNIMPSLHPQSAIPLCNLFAEMTQQICPQDPSAAESLYSQFCTTVEMIYGKNSCATSDCYSTLMAYFASTRKLKLATEYAGRALVIRIRHLGAKNVATADSHYNLALLLRLQNDFSEAKRQFSYALAIREELDGESLSVASTHMALGKTCELLGGFKEESFVHYSKVRFSAIWVYIDILTNK